MGVTNKEELHLAIPVASRLVLPLSEEEATNRIRECRNALVGLECDGLVQIAATGKSSVYRCKLGGREAVVKQFAEDAGFRTELFAYSLLEGAPVPRLLRYSIQHRTLILEYIEHGPWTVDKRILAETLAKIHSSSRINTERRPALFHRYSALTLARDSSGGRTRRIYERLAQLGGQDYVSCAINDIKVDHILRRADNYLFIDLETFALGRLEFLDIFACERLLAPEHRDGFALEYCRARSDLSRSQRADYQNLVEFARRQFMAPATTGD